MIPGLTVQVEVMAFFERWCDLLQLADDTSCGLDTVQLWLPRSHAAEIRSSNGHNRGLGWAGPLGHNGINLGPVPSSV